MLGGLDFGAEVLGLGNAVLAFDVDQDEVVGFGPVHGERFSEDARGVYIESGDAEHLVAEGPEHLSAADVEDTLLRIRSVPHWQFGHQLGQLQSVAATTA